MKTCKLEPTTDVPNEKKLPYLTSLKHQAAKVCALLVGATGWPALPGFYHPPLQ